MEKHFTIALAGNPNSGKTTSFNSLTGSHQHVVNYPGVTVEKKIGYTKLDETKVELIDLPGTYSLTAYSQEEIVARRVLIEDKPDVALAVLNSVALERNLYLVLQIMELGVPVVLALNMIDEAKEQGMTINAKKLSELLGVPVIETIAKTGEGLKTALAESIKFAEEKKANKITPLVISYGTDIDLTLDKLSEKINQYPELINQYPTRWLALKFIENDFDIKQQIAKQNLELHNFLETQVNELTKHLQTTLGTFPEAVIADYRYGFISSLMRNGIVQRKENNAERIARSDKIDQVLTNKLFGPLILLAILYLIYELTFTLGAYPMEWLEALFGWLGDFATTHLADGLFKSLVVDGIIAGVGGVLVFVPLLMITFFLIAILEDSGYMARMAYMLDRIFRVFGLHGNSVMPFIVAGGIAGGCAVPGVMSSRTLRSPREKLATVLTVPFMNCGAKLPVFLLIIGAFFSQYQTIIMFGITLLGWLIALIVARILRSTVISGPSTPFVMELPPYRFPTLLGLCIHTIERTWEYIRRAITILLAVSVLLWAAMTFPILSQEEQAKTETQITLVEQKLEEFKNNTNAEQNSKKQLLLELEGLKTKAFHHTYAGRLGTFLEPITQYAGFDWRTNIALIGGTAAKEVIVSTLGTAYAITNTGDEDSATQSLSARLANDPSWSIATALSLIIFVLIYAPCIVTLVVIRQETGSWKWTFFSLIFNTALAYVLAVCVYQVSLKFLN